MKDDVVYLIHILECIRRIEEDIAEGEERFRSSHMVQDAVLRNLQTLGESAKRITDVCKTAHPEVEWQRIVAFRNVLVHDYLGINIERIWEIVQRDVPPLKSVVVAILSEMGTDYK
jgi:uncharacterized protein with HEPN domain